jgi:hypothetical protein
MVRVPEQIRVSLDAVMADRPESQSQAYERLMQATTAPVDWADVAWPELAAATKNKSNRVRAIAAQVLCNLAKSAEPSRVLADLDNIMAVTHDERFVTARHTIQSLWKIGVADPEVRAALLARIEHRFAIAAAEKNSTLIRYDLLVGLHHLHEETADPAIPPLAQRLVASELDAKYVKKYRTVWKA